MSTRRTRTRTFPIESSSTRWSDADRLSKLGRSLAIAHEVDGFDLRKCRLNRFPFTFVFFEHDEKFVVVAVAHNKRRPLYWRSRLPSTADP